MKYTYKILLLCLFNQIFSNPDDNERLFQKRKEQLTQELEDKEEEIQNKNEMIENLSKEVAEWMSKYNVAEANIQYKDADCTRLLREQNIGFDRIIKEKNREIDQLKKTSFGSKAAPYVVAITCAALTFVIGNIYYTLYIDTGESSKKKKDKNSTKVDLAENKI
ncbi:hypothetical protein [Alphaproteobacteria bacterium endosymbiont of Tiliacea citrago]|uniref:hypothetical protein n=1 Tax=Alphaproteobacteria bacterium endosymbiont of Tiliacea citrago TaxID=3077944 RepID=UPI00313E0811